MTGAGAQGLTGRARPRLDRAGLAGLLRPRIAVLVLVETGAGYLLARPTDWTPLPWLLLATLLVAGAGCALNHLLEREADARMPRTRLRPLVTGALTPGQVAWGGGLSLATGLALAWVACNPLTAGLLALASGIYLGVYTPLKRRTSTNTWVGAVPGALPVLAGAAAVGGRLDLLPLLTFLLIVLWQLPHFFAIASMYRDDYQAGGMRMLSGDDPQDELLRWQMPLQVMSVVLVSILPAVLGSARILYAGSALALGAMFLASAWAFRRRPERAQARRVVLASVVYLPLVLTALVLDTSCSQPSPAEPSGLPVYSRLPEFTLIDQSGKPFGRDDMAGESWLVDFIFTSCAGICVPMSRGYVTLQEEGQPVRYLSVSVDPARDDPAALTAYREKWDGDPERWTLATGALEAVEALANEGFKLPAVGRREGAAAEGMPEMFHSGKYALVDAQGHIRGYYDHADRVELDRLRADIATLADAP